jgi:hypothetical protein
VQYSGQTVLRVSVPVAELSNKPVGSRVATQPPTRLYLLPYYRTYGGSFRRENKTGFTCPFYSA